MTSFKRTPSPGRAPLGSARTRIATGISMGGLSVFASGLSEATLGLFALKGAISLVEAGFGAISKSATELVGAIAQIGGARGLQQMFVEAATSQRLAAGIANNTTDNASTKDIMDMVNRISSKSEFTPEQIGAMARAFVGKTGSINAFDRLGQFPADLASVGNLAPEESGRLLGQLSAQFPQLDAGQIKQAAINLWKAGKSGAVELKDASSLSEVFGLSGKVSPDALSGINLEAGLVQKAQIYTGGQDAREAVTGVRRMQADLLNVNKIGKLTASLGEYITHSATGEAVFANAPNTFARLAIGAMDNTLPANSVDARGMKALTGIANSEQAEFARLTGTANEKKEAEIAILENLFKKMMDGNTAIDEFDGSLKNVQDTVEFQLKKAFNDLSGQLEGALLPILQEMVPIVNRFATSLTDRKDEIRDTLEDVVSGLTGLVNYIPIVIAAMSKMTSAALWVWETTQRLTGNPVGKDEIAAKIQENNEEIARRKEEATAHPYLFDNDRNSKSISDLQKANEELQKNYALYKQIEAAQNPLTPYSIDSANGARDSLSSFSLFDASSSEEGSETTKTYGGKVPSAHPIHSSSLGQKEAQEQTRYLKQLVDLAQKAQTNAKVPAPPKASPDGHHI